MKLNGMVILSKIVPSNSNDKYATHESIYGQGGWREVKNKTERNTITCKRRTNGMAVYVQDDDLLYILNTSEERLNNVEILDDTDWFLFHNGLTGSFLSSNYPSGTGTLIIDQIEVGNTTSAAGINSLAIGFKTLASGNYSTAIGYQTLASGDYSFAHGLNVSAIDLFTYAAGAYSLAMLSGAHTEGFYTSALGKYSHAEGVSSIASGNGSHTEGTETSAFASNSHAEGGYTLTKGAASHAEGGYTSTVNAFTHAEGYYTYAGGQNAHAEGYKSYTSAMTSHAEGESNIIFNIGTGSHAEGKQTMISGRYAHTEGYNTINKGDFCHSEGVGTIVSYSLVTMNKDEYKAKPQHVEGRYNIEDINNQYQHIVGNGIISTVIGNIKVSEFFTNERPASTWVIAKTEIKNNIEYVKEAIKRNNIQTLDWDGNLYNAGTVSASHFVLNNGEQIDGNYLTKNNPVGTGTLTISRINIGNNSKVTSDYSLAFGYCTSAINNYTFAGGYTTCAAAVGSHAEGQETYANGQYSHVEGYKSKTFKNYSHAEGSQTIADGQNAHTEGEYTSALNNNAHAEGHYTVAYAYAAHAEGSETSAYGRFSHAEGYYTLASGFFSHSEGIGTIAFNSDTGISFKYKAKPQHVEGRYNIEDINNQYQHIVGNGIISTVIGNIKVSEFFNTERLASVWVIVKTEIKDNIEYVKEVIKRNNIQTLDWNGNLWNTGKVSANAFYYLDGTELVPGIQGQYLSANNPTGTGILKIPKIQAGNFTLTTLGSIGNYSVAAGYNTVAKGQYSHAEGYATSAISENSHAEGSNSIANGSSSHAEGNDNIVLTIGSHVEGYQNIVGGRYAHGEGRHTITSGLYAHAEGLYTIAMNKDPGVDSEYATYPQHTEGRYNLPDNNNKYQHIVGAGSIQTFNPSILKSEFFNDERPASAWVIGEIEIKDNVEYVKKAVKRNNIQTLDWDGNLYNAGTVSASHFVLNNGEQIDGNYLTKTDPTGTGTLTIDDIKLNNIADNTLLIYKNNKITALTTPSQNSVLTFTDGNYKWISYNTCPTE